MEGAAQPSPASSQPPQEKPPEGKEPESEHGALAQVQSILRELPKYPASTLVTYVARRFVRDSCASVASALSYTSLLAMGFVGPEKGGILDQLGVAMDDRGNVRAYEVSYQTSVPGVFACGDLRRGQSLVVWAISEGREAAVNIDK